MADDLIKEAREALENSYNYDKDNRREAAEDMRFVAGYHWSRSALAERRGRPTITINRSQQFLRQVSNPIRQNMPVLKVEPFNAQEDEMAEIINGIMRRIQYNSSAGHVYAQAVEHAVACGIGWFRVTTDYATNSSFDQEIYIKRIFNPLTVYPDPGATEPDRSDMMYCCVSEPMPLQAFKAKYPNASISSMDVPTNGANEVLWGTGEWMRVAEFWRRKEVPGKLLQLKDGSTHELTEEGIPQLEALQAAGVIANVRDVKKYKVEMTLVSGHEQLAETYEFPCEYIPLIPVIGAEVPLDKGVYRHGLIRFQREPQQLHNYFLSVAAETLGQQPKTPYLVTQKMIGKYKGLWDNANRDATPYLPYEPDPTAPGQAPQRVAPPPLPSGLVEMAQLMQDDMKSATGIYDAALGNRSNETSGVAIGARVEQGNQATFHYVDNLEHSLEHLGRILVGVIPKVYDTERTMNIMGEDDTEKEVTINQQVMSYDGQPMINNDISKINYNSIRVVLGPNFASRKQEAVRTLVQLIQAMPQIGQVAGDIVAKNLDFEGAEQLAERLKAILPPPILALENPQAAQPDPMQQMHHEMEMQMMQTKLASEQAKAEQEKHKVETVQLDNAMKVDRLANPPPMPSGTQAGNQAPF